MRVYIVGPQGLNKYTEKNLDVVIESIKCTETGETIEITIGEMSDEEYESLPEYEGP